VKAFDFGLPQREEDFIVARRNAASPLAPGVFLSYSRCRDHVPATARAEATVSSDIILRECLSMSTDASTLDSGESGMFTASGRRQVRLNAVQTSGDRMLCFARTGSIAESETVTRRSCG